MARDLTLLAAVLTALSLSAAVASGQERARPTAASLADPTRPPAHFAGSYGAEGAHALAGPVLQSVLISPGRKSAIISGERIELGEKVGEARLARLTEAEAVLEGPEGRTVLKLVPKVEKNWKKSP